jgi:ribose transport system permease protein
MTTTASAPQPSSTTPSGQSVARKLSGQLASGTASWLLVAQILILIAFTVANSGTFDTVTNVRSIAIQAAILLVLATGETFVIATAGIDLSVGGILVFSSVLSAKAMASTTAGIGLIVLGLIVALAAGAAFGMINAFLVARAHVPSLIVTLGTFGMSLGAAQLISDGTDITTVPASLVNSVGFGRIAGIPYLVIIGGGVAVFGLVVLRMTRFGRYTIALGSNAEALRRSGVKVNRVTVRVYMIAGVLSGLAGYLSLAQFSATTLNGHESDNLTAVTAVVLGGTSLFGGVATMVGTIIGVLIPVTLQNGFVISGLQPFWQQIAIGAVLILAVHVDYLRRGGHFRRGG